MSFTTAVKDEDALPGEDAGVREGAAVLPRRLPLAGKEGADEGVADIVVADVVDDGRERHGPAPLFVFLAEHFAEFFEIALRTGELDLGAVDREHPVSVLPQLPGGVPAVEAVHGQVEKLLEEGRLYPLPCPGEGLLGDVGEGKRLPQVDHALDVRLHLAFVRVEEVYDGLVHGEPPLPYEELREAVGFQELLRFQELPDAGDGGIENGFVVHGHLQSENG